MQWGSQLMGRKSRLTTTMVGRRFLTGERFGVTCGIYCNGCSGSSVASTTLSSSSNTHISSSRYFAGILSRRMSSNGFGTMKDKLNNVFTSKSVLSQFSAYRQAIGLQLEGFLKRNSVFLYGTAGIVMCYVLWRVMFWIATISVGVSEGLAKYGFLALSSAIVAFAGIFLRSRLGINPDKVYRMAMAKLNTSASILEVMGAPLTGTDVRAYVMSGGGLKAKNFKPALRPKRCFLIFPVQGSERKGLVSVEVKKKKGQYDMKLLAVDIPMGSGADQRFFLQGDEKEYNIGGGFIYELRDSLVKAIAARKEFDDQDLVEEEDTLKKE